MSQTLQTARLRLRPWEERDQAPYARLNADPVAMAHFNARLTPEETRAAIARYEAARATHGFGFLAVEHRESGAFLGMVGIAPVRWEGPFTPAVEVSWRLLPAYWGNGYAPEAARACIRDGFENHGLREIVAFTLPGNLPSRRVMEKIGMERDLHGDFDHPLLPEGHPMRRHVLYRITTPPQEA